MTTQPHPPKVETFDLDAMVNIDNKGIARTVEEFRVEPFGLYLARPTPGRRQFHYLESWLLPELGLRVTDFWFTPGHERDHDFYLDVGQFSCAGRQWLARDLYLDIALREGDNAAVLDTDELIAAAVGDVITPADTVYALETAYTAIDALARSDYRLNRWLGTLGMRLSWRRRCAE